MLLAASVFREGGGKVRGKMGKKTRSTGGEGDGVQTAFLGAFTQNHSFIMKPFYRNPKPDATFESGCELKSCRKAAR